MGKLHRLKLAIQAKKLSIDFTPNEKQKILDKARPKIEQTVYNQYKDASQTEINSTVATLEGKLRKHYNLGTVSFYCGHKFNHDKCNEYVKQGAISCTCPCHLPDEPTKIELPLISNPIVDKTKNTAWDKGFI